MFDVQCSLHRERIASIPRLISFLELNPFLTELCGFTDGIPDATVFYRFLNETEHSMLEGIHIDINQQLIDAKAVTLEQFTMDSKPVMAPTKDNNSKNSKRSRNKHKKINRNPDATLGYYSQLEMSGGTKRTDFF